MTAKLLVITSCVSSSPPIIISDFKDKYFPFPNDPASIEWAIKAPPKGWQYIKVNESTKYCEKEKEPELKKSCQQNFLKNDFRNR